jgi:hypothetical protein
MQNVLDERTTDLAALPKDCCSSNQVQPCPATHPLTTGCQMADSAPTSLERVATIDDDGGASYEAGLIRG